MFLAQRLRRFHIASRSFRIARGVYAFVLLAGTAFGQVAAGGAQAPPPYFSQVGTDVATNGQMSTHGGAPDVPSSWGTIPACGTYDGGTGSDGAAGRYKLVNCGAGPTTILTQNISIAGGHEAFRISFKVQTDSTTPVPTFSLSILDNTHGSVVPLQVSTFPADFMTVGASSDWVQVSYTTMTNPYLHSGDTWQFIIKTSTQTGTIYIDDVKAEPVWFPLRTFLKYPNWRYLWTDKTPPSIICNSTSVAAQICGVSEIDPIPGTSLAQSTLTVKFATAAGCGSGVASTQTFNSPSAVQHWQITPAQYGAVSAGTKYYVCTQLTVTSGGAVQGTYSDWGIVPEPSSFRSGLMNWIAEDGSWNHNQVPQIAFGPYDRWGCIRYGSTNSFTTKNGYINGIRGFRVTDLPIASPSLAGCGAATNKAPASSVFTDYSVNHFNLIMSINPASGFNPTGGSDNVTPYMDALQDFGQSHFQIINQDDGYMFSETNVQTQPNGGTTPALTAIAGNIDTSVNGWLHVELSGVAYANRTGSVGSGSLVTESIPTTAGSSHVSVAACGVACGVQVTTPSCTVGRVWGYRMYLAQNNSGTPPANSSFDRVYPSYTGKQLDQDILPCSTTVTIGTGTPGLPHSGLAPLSTEIISTNRQTFNGALTDKATWKAYSDLMPSHVGAGGLYIADEAVLTSFPSVWYAHNYLSGVANGQLTWGVLQYASGMTMFRDTVDVPNDDPYGYSWGISPDERKFIPAARSCTLYDTTNNHPASVALCSPAKIDIWSDAMAHDVYGARPQWPVIQLFNHGGANSFPYAEVWRQYIKAMVGCQNWGSLGCGVTTWGRVSSLGMEDAFYVQGNTNAWTDEFSANNAFSRYFPILLTPIKDTTHLGKGSIVSSVSNTGAIGTVCTNAVGSGGYQDGTAFPDGPIRFVSHLDPVTLDQYIFATNLCDGTTTATFNLVGAPGGQTKVEVEDEAGRRTPLTITANSFSDSWTSLGAYVYVIRNPNRHYRQGVTTTSGKSQ